MWHIFARRPRCSVVDPEWFSRIRILPRFVKLWSSFLLFQKPQKNVKYTGLLVQSPVCSYCFIWFLAILFYLTFSDRLACVMWKRAEPEWFPGSGSDLDIKFLICSDPQHCLDVYLIGSEVFQKKIMFISEFCSCSILPTLLFCSKISNELFFKYTVSSNGSRETPEINIVEGQEIYILWRLRPVKTSDLKRIVFHPINSASLGGHLLFF
jgi:hypothetical protein